MPPLNQYQRCKIIVYYEENVPIKEIARRLNLTRNTVRLWIRRYGETGAIDRNRPGPKPKMFTPESQRHQDIIATHLENIFATTSSTAENYGISRKTVRKHLHAGGFGRLKPVRKIAHPLDHRQERFHFAQQYLNFDWVNNVVIFTREKWFLIENDGQKILSRNKGERFKELCGIPGRISSGPEESLGCWGWMSSMGPGELVEVGAYFDKDSCIEVLRDIMLPSVRIAYPDTELYIVQENSSLQHAAVVRKWLESQDGIHVISWPSKSQDLNPFEDLWSQIVHNWSSSNVQSESTLSGIVMSSWESMRGSEHCWNFFCGMRDRLQQVIEKDGGPLH